MAHHQHHHQVADSSLVSDRTRWLLGGAVAVVAAMAVIGAVVLWPAADRPDVAEEIGLGAEIVRAEVTAVAEVACAGSHEIDGIRCIEVGFDVTDGSPAGEDASFQTSISEASVDFGVGDRITLGYQPGNDPGFEYYFNDFQRRTSMLWLAGLFAVAVVALGRLQGVRALVALGVTGAVMVGFMFPSILDGNSPTAVALVAAGLIAIAALYLTHGASEMVTVALLGTFAALGLTAALAAVFASLARFTGFGTEDAFYLTIASADVDVRGLVLAGIIIGSLGVLDDVTVTQVSAVWQLHEANPGFSARRLYAAGVIIGRDHVASAVNTLVLAYAGASLPLLLLFTQGGRALGDVAEGELVAVEVVRSLVGSIGLVAAVPITTALAALVVTRGSAVPGATETARPPDRPSPDAASLEPGWEQFARGDESW